jgi:hypothetical protein
MAVACRWQRKNSLTLGIGLVAFSGKRIFDVGTLPQTSSLAAGTVTASDLISVTRNISHHCAAHS